MGFEPPISAGERPQIHVLDREAVETGPDRNDKLKKKRSKLLFEFPFFFSQQFTIRSVQEIFYFFIYNIHFSAHIVAPWALLPGVDVPFAPTPSQEIPLPYYAHGSPSPQSRKKIGNTAYKKKC